MILITLKQALEALESAQMSNYGRDWVWPDTAHPTAMAMVGAAITALRQAIEQAEKQEPVADRDAFERHWKKVRGDKKSDRELKRHPLQPQTYIQDSANRHWVTWQAATRKASPPQRQPLTDEEIDRLEAMCIDPIDSKGWGFLNRKAFARAIEAAHGIKGEA
jgi:hypothetical protein